MCICNRLTHPVILKGPMASTVSLGCDQTSLMFSLMSSLYFNEETNVVTIIK